MPKYNYSQGAPVPRTTLGLYRGLVARIQLSTRLKECPDSIIHKAQECPDSIIHKARGCPSTITHKAQRCQGLRLDFTEDWSPGYSYPQGARMPGFNNPQGSGVPEYNYSQGATDAKNYAGLTLEKNARIQLSTRQNRCQGYPWSYSRIREQIGKDWTQV